MKKHIFILLAICCLWQILPAQNDSSSRWTLELSGGPAVLAGPYIKWDYNASSGYASQTGSYVGAKGTWYFSRYLGLGLSFNRSSFAPAHLQSLSDSMQQAFDVDSSSVITKGHYSFNNLVIGPSVSIPVSKKLFLEFQLLGGICYATTPQFRTDLEDSQINYTFYQDAAHAVAFAWQAGVGIRFQTGKHLGFRLGADLYSAQPAFKIKNEGHVNNAGRLVTAYDQYASITHIALSVVWSFSK